MKIIAVIFSVSLLIFSAWGYVNLDNGYLKTLSLLLIILSIYFFKKYFKVPL